jgi:hypothetical protein
MSGTVWEPGRQMGTQEETNGAPSDLADATHEPNQSYDRQELEGGTAAQLPDAIARVRRSLGEARASTERVVVDRLIADVEALLVSVEGVGTSDQSESPTATAPADLEQ